MSVTNLGEMEIEYANDANVPVVCFLTAPDDSASETGKWEFTAINFMPRKERCGGRYHVVADTKSELMDVINKYVTPLYDIAARNLRETGGNYYWEPKEELKPKKSPLQYC